MVAIAKKTGDYSVLSHTDISVVALTYELDLHEKAEAEKIKVGHVSPRLVLTNVLTNIAGCATRSDGFRSGKDN